MTPVRSEREEIERIAQEYRDRGYAVAVHPRGDGLPSFLAGTSPDLIAISEGEKVLIEVKWTTELRRSPDLTDFAKRVEAHPGWRFELVTISRIDPNLGVATHSKRWSIREIQTRLKEAHAIAKAGHCDAALLIAYAAVEAALFAWTDSSSTKEIQTLRTARAIVRQMAIEGAIGRRELAQFQRIEELRNALAHGVAAREASRSDVNVLIEFATLVLKSLREVQS